MSIVLALCLYGIYEQPDYPGAKLKIRKPIEMLGYRLYLIGFCLIVAWFYRRKRLSGLILCGGFTNSICPSESEANSVLEPLKRMLRRFGVDPNNFYIILEEASYNTPQNIYKATTLLSTGLESLSPNIIVVCDAVRWLKVKVVCRRLMEHLEHHWQHKVTRKINIVGVIGCPRPDTHPNSRWWVQLGAAWLYSRNSELFLSDIQAVLPRQEPAPSSPAQAIIPQI